MTIAQRNKISQLSQYPMISKILKVIYSSLINLYIFNLAQRLSCQKFRVDTFSLSHNTLDRAAVYVIGEEYKFCAHLQGDNLKDI